MEISSVGLEIEITQRNYDWKWTSLYARPLPITGVCSYHPHLVHHSDAFTHTPKYGVFACELKYNTLISDRLQILL